VATRGRGEAGAGAGRWEGHRPTVGSGCYYYRPHRCLKLNERLLEVFAPKNVTSMSMMVVRVGQVLEGVSVKAFNDL
jgi:hypothetical protein